MCSGSWWTWGSCSERSTLITPEGGVDNDGSHSLIVDECTSEGERLSTSEDGVYALINGVENSRVEAISKKFMVSPRSCSQSYEVDDITFVFAESYLHRVNPGRSIQFGVHNIVSGNHQVTPPIKPTGKADYQNSVEYNERVSIGNSQPTNNGGDYCEHTCIEFSIWENVLGTDNECVLWSGSIRGARAFFTEGQGTRFKIPEACSGMIKPVANVCPPESDMEMSGFSYGSSWNGDYFPRKFTSGDQKGQTYWESRTAWKYLYHKQVPASDYWCLGSSLTNCEYFAYNADPANPSTSGLSWKWDGSGINNPSYPDASVGCKMSVVSLESWLLFGYLNGVEQRRNLLVKEEAEETEEIAEVIFEEIVEEIENRQLPEETCDNIYMDLAVTGGLSEIKISIPYVNRDFTIWEDGDGQIDMNAGQLNLFSPNYITCADLNDQDDGTSDVFSLVTTGSSSTSKCTVSGQCFSSVDYSAYENCEFTLSAGLSGQLVISSFAVENGGPNCYYDYLEI